MPSKIYLTIDDSPSAHTDELTDFLLAHNIPAILFCRGDRLAEHPKAAIRAIQKGFIIANHAYSHRRASTLTYEEMVEEIQKTELLIDKAYKEAGTPRPVKYFRFPHIDRGCGGWVVDYDAVPEYRDILTSLFSEGLNITLTPPSDGQKEKKSALQSFLRAEGFVTPFEGITHPWYTATEMATAVDALFTYSTADWMLSSRHAGKWPYKTWGDLKQKIDDDPWLHDENSTHVILLHDQNGLLNVSKEILQYFLNQEFVFVDFKN